MACKPSSSSSLRSGSGQRTARHRAGGRGSRAIGRHAVSVESVVGASRGRQRFCDAAAGPAAVGALQLLFAPDTEPSDVELATLATFGVRAAQALRGERSHAHRRARARAHPCAPHRRRPGDRELSLSHTLETAVARVARAARSRPRRRLPPRGRPAEAAAGPARRPARGRRRAAARSGARPVPLARGARRRRRRRRIAGSAACATRPRKRGSRPRIAVPLLAQDEVIGLLGVYPAAGARARPRTSRRCSRACRAAGGRRAERAAARAREAARQGARARARCGARRPRSSCGAVRDLTFVRAEPVARGDAGGSREHGRRRARRRRRGHPHARRAPRVAGAEGDEGRRAAARGGRARDPRISRTAVRSAPDPASVPDGEPFCWSPRDRAESALRRQLLVAVPRARVDRPRSCRSRRRRRCSRR